MKTEIVNTPGFKEPAVNFNIEGSPDPVLYVPAALAADPDQLQQIQEKARKQLAAREV